MNSNELYLLAESTDKVLLKNKVIEEMIEGKLDMPKWMIEAIGNGKYPYPRFLLIKHDYCDDSLLKKLSNDPFDYVKAEAREKLLWSNLPPNCITDTKQIVEEELYQVTKRDGSNSHVLKGKAVLRFIKQVSGTMKYDKYAPPNFSSFELFNLEYRVVALRTYEVIEK